MASSDRTYLPVDRVERSNGRGEAGAEGQRNPLHKTLQVLAWMVEALPEDGGVREMAQALRMAPSTVHRTLRLLAEEGLVQVDSGSGRYHLGLEFLRLAWKATARFPLSRVALPIMRELVNACNETAVLGIYDPARMEMVLSATVESSHRVRYIVELPRWVPVYAGASGLAIMAFLSKEERRQVVARTGLKAITARTITDPVRLEQELERVRVRGYALAEGQRYAGAVSLAAPVWGTDGRVLASLGLTIPEHRFDRRAEPELARQLIHFARKATEQLGGRVPEGSWRDGSHI